MRPPLLFDVAHATKPCLLEGTPGAAIGLLHGRDAGVRAESREGDVLYESLEDPRPEPVARELVLADQQIDPGDTLADLNDLLPVRVIGSEVRLDHSNRTAVDHDQVHVGRIEPVDRLLVLREGLLDRVAPPAANVLAPQPRSDQRQVGLPQRLELDHGAWRARKRERSPSRVSSSRTPNRRQAPR